MPTDTPLLTPVESLAVELRAARLSLAVALILTVVKFVAYFLTHSDAVYSDALENVANVLTAAFALYAISIAHRPADRNHPYGHGKIEFMSAGLEGGMIVLAALLIAGKVAIQVVNHAPPQTQRLDTGMILMGAALVVNGGLGIYLKKSGQQRGALVLEASGAHLISDAVDSVAVLVALALVKWTGIQWLDSAAAVLVAIYIALLGLNLLRRAAAGLMDEQDVADETRLRKLLDGHVGPGGKEPRICGFHKLRHRHSGRYHWIDFHIQVPGKWDVDKGHQVASAIEFEIEKMMGEGKATAHVEPCVEEGCGNCSKS